MTLVMMRNATSTICPGLQLQMLKARHGFVYSWEDLCFDYNFVRLVLQGSSADRSQWREPTRTPDALCSLYEAALCLFEEVRDIENKSYTIC